MSEKFSNQNRDRLMIAHFVDPIDSGRQFDIWPLHVTLIPWFHMDKEEAQERLELAVKDLRSFRIALGKIAMKTFGDIDYFGKNNDIAVRRIIEPASLNIIHGRLLCEFYNNLEDTAFVASDYKPHVTINKDNDPGLGGIIKVDEVSLIEYDKSQKTVIGNYNLND